MSTSPGIDTPTGTVPYDYVPSGRQLDAHQMVVDELLYGGAAGGGKLLAYSTPMLTTDGWTTHGALKPGDRVFGHDGKPVTVLASYTPATECHYLVTFSTGETIRAGREHLWTVQTNADRQKHTRADPAYKARRRATRGSRAVPAPRKGANQSAVVSQMNRDRAEVARANETRPSVWRYARTVETHELADLVNEEGKAVSIPSPDAITTTGEWAGVTPPWVLGMWLGDGSRASADITQGDEDADELIQNMAANGYRLRSFREPNRYRFETSDGQTLSSHITRDLGHHTVRVKHVPGWVFTAPYADRLAVVQGLLDADGHVNRKGQVELSLSDERLAADAAKLLATLGIRCTPTPRYAGYADVRCRDRWRVKFTTGLPVVKYRRKLARLKVADDKPPRTRSIYVTSVEKIAADEPANCIAVDDPEHIYLAGRTLVPTHNTRFALAEAVFCALMVPGSRVLILRRNYPDLEDVEDKLRSQMPGGVAAYRPGKHRWEFTNESIIRLGHLAHDDDVNKYIGQEYTLIIFEEATEFSPDQYLTLLSRLRAAGQVKDRLDELGWRPRSIATANPGRRSHQFFKDRFVDAARPGKAFRPLPTPEDPDPGVRCYIPAKYTDNPHIDPTYVRRLNALPESRRRAFRDGDWDVLEGVRFPQFRRGVHVIEPAELPISVMSGRKVVAVDYGYNDPFAALWLAKLADGLIVVYRELYAVGLTATQQAERIKAMSEEEERRSGEHIPVVADPAMWHRRDGGSQKPLDKDAPPVGSPAHFYQQVLGHRPLKANNAREHGWNLIDEKLRVREDDEPRLLIYDNCLDLIRTLPSAPRDKKRPEDLDTSAEEHNLDALRYGAMWLEGVTSRRPTLNTPGSGRRVEPPLAARVRAAQF